MCDALGFRTPETSALPLSLVEQFTAHAAPTAATAVFVVLMLCAKQRRNISLWFRYATYLMACVGASAAAVLTWRSFDLWECEGNEARWWAYPAIGASVALSLVALLLATFHITRIAVLALLVTAGACIAVEWRLRELETRAAVPLLATQLAWCLQTVALSPLLPLRRMRISGAPQTAALNVDPLALRRPRSDPPNRVVNVWP